METCLYQWFYPLRDGPAKKAIDVTGAADLCILVTAIQTVPSFVITARSSRQLYNVAAIAIASLLPK